MATYNGVQYIEKQLESIIAQTFEDWVLFIRDDGSTDGTKQVLERYAQTYTGKIIIIEDSSFAGGSAKANFAAIHVWVSAHSPSEYYMFADQDDVWHPNKIEVTLKKMVEVEREKGGPVLVHTDLQVVDENLNVLGKSLFQYRALNPNIVDLSHLLIQNNVTGCTMCWNSRLNSLIDLTPDGITMHDWWITLIASAFGTIEYIPQQTMKYRQHRFNVVGAMRVNTVGFILRRITKAAYVKETLRVPKTQAELFLNRFKDALDTEQTHIITNFIKLFSYPKIKRVLAAINGNYLKQGPVQIIGELLFL